MQIDQSLDIERCRLLTATAQIGWWEANFTTHRYLCSDFVCQLLGLASTTLTFSDFGYLIRSDYRTRIGNEFLSIPELEFYEQTFPIHSTQGVVWVRSRLGKKWKDDSGQLMAYGILQVVDTPEHAKFGDILNQFNDLLFRQHTISHSLRNFLKEDRLDDAISYVLKDVLELFRGGRVYIIEYDDTNNTQSCTYEVVAPDVTPEINLLTNVPTNATPWWTEQIKADKPILLNSLADLPKEAHLEFELLDVQNITSLMVVPLRNADNVWGYIGIDLTNRHYRWTNEDYQWFSSLANIISICISLRRAKDKVEREHTFMDNLYRHLPMGYVHLTAILDEQKVPTDYFITDANQFGAELSGYPLEKFKRKLISEVYMPQQLKRRIKMLADIQDQDHFVEIEEQFVHTGKTCHCFVYSPQPNELVCLYRDVTEMHRTYTALDRSEKLLRNLFSSIPLGIEVYDRDGVLLDLNTKDMEIFGVARKEDVLGVNLFDNPNLEAHIKERVRMEDELDFSQDYKFQNIHSYHDTTHTGYIELYTKVSKIYSSEGECTGFLLINIDNTEHISSLNRIRDFENFFLLISDYAKVGYSKINLLTHEGYAIKQWYKNMGEEPDTPMEKIIGVYNRMHPDDRKRVQLFFDNAKRGEASNFKGEVRIIHPDTPNEWNWLRMNIVLNHFEPEAGIIEVIGVNYDITELKNTEYALIRAKEQAEKSDRLKSSFLANMSHEIRTPLNAIVGFSSLLVEVEDEDEKREYWKLIEKNNVLLLQLISDILDLSKIEVGAFDMRCAAVDMNKLCTDLVNSMYLNVQPGVQLLFTPTMEECIIQSDSSLLTQVLANFVSNAIKFTTEGIIRVGYEQHNDGYLLVYVSDTGIGISAEHLPTIFERFIKLNSFTQGTGLGLSISRSIIEQLGGKIGAESELGRGSRFWFKLPI